MPFDGPYMKLESHGPSVKLKSEPPVTLLDNCTLYESKFIMQNDVVSKNDYRSVFTYNRISSEWGFPDRYKEPTWPVVTLQYIILYLSCILAFLLFPLATLLCVKKVHSLERLVVFRFGRQQPIKGPGYVFLLPFVDKCTRVDLNPMKFTISTPQVLTVDGGIVEVAANVEYRVSDVLNYVKKSRNPIKSVQDLSTYSLVNAVTGKYQEELEKERETIGEILKVQLNQTLVKWGVEIISISLNPVKILKSAEPVSAISTVMDALKGIAEQSSLNSLCVGVVNQTQESLPTLPSEKSLDPEIAEERSHIVPLLQHFATSAANKEKVKDMSAIIKLEILSAIPKIVYIIIYNGNISVCENVESKEDPEISVALSEGTLQDILNGRINTLATYLEGKITATGNLSLLQTLSELLN